MTDAWPRNIVPYDETRLRALSTVESLALYSASLDKPLDESTLTKEHAAIAHELLDAGVLRREGGRLWPTSRHRRDAEADVPGRLEHKRAVVTFTRSILDETRGALERDDKTLAGLGYVTFPDRPKVLAEAMGILAEAEDQLRALAEETSADPRGEVRVVLFVGSLP